MKNKIQPAERQRRQADITIEPDGKVNLSFLWDDLEDLIRPKDVEIAACLDHGFSIPQIPSLSPDLLNEYSNCKLCPKKCGFNRLKRKHPTCGGVELQIATSGLGKGDEQVIRGVRGSGLIMLSGCNLKCPSCHNPEMVKNGTSSDIERFVAICCDLANAGAHNIQILSPTVHLPFLQHGLQILKNHGFPLPIAFKSSGYECPEQLRKFAGLVDIYIPDAKFGPDSAWAKRAGVSDYFAVLKSAVEEMYSQVGDFQLNADGTAMKGVLVRRVNSPLPESEQVALFSYLESLPKGIRVAYHDNFLCMD